MTTPTKEGEKSPDGLPPRDFDEWLAMMPQDVRESLLSSVN